MKRLLKLVLAMTMCLGLVACGGNETSNDQTTNDQTDQQDQINDQDVGGVISLDELYGTYVSMADGTTVYIFTAEEITFDENNRVLTTPLYQQKEGKDKQPIAIYSLEISGNILTVVTWQGEQEKFEIILENDTITLDILEEEHKMNIFDIPEMNAFLSTLVKQN